MKRAHSVQSKKHNEKVSSERERTSHLNHRTSPSPSIPWHQRKWKKRKFLYRYFPCIVSAFFFLIYVFNFGSGINDQVSNKSVSKETRYTGVITKVKEVDARSGDSKDTTRKRRSAGILTTEFHNPNKRSRKKSFYVNDYKKQKGMEKKENSSKSILLERHKRGKPKNNDHTGNKTQMYEGLEWDGNHPLHRVDNSMSSVTERVSANDPNSNRLHQEFNEARAAENLGIMTNIDNEERLVDHSEKLYNNLTQHFPSISQNRTYIDVSKHMFGSKLDDYESKPDAYSNTTTNLQSTPIETNWNFTTDLADGTPCESCSKAIKRISILGERNSGTTWIHNELKKCFGDDLKVRRGLTRDKHWFQYDDGREHDQTLLIAQFRNPYHWVLGMRERPHHAPAHFDLDWRDFVNKTWSMPRQGLDLLITDHVNPICQERFTYTEVNSCVHHHIPSEYFQHGGTRFSEQYPTYELKRDNSGEPFANILELRTAKINEFLSYGDSFPFVETVISTRYEALVEEGTQNLIKNIEKWTNTTAKCVPSLPQKRAIRELEPDFVEYINEHLDWEAENLIGYTKVER